MHFLYGLWLPDHVDGPHYIGVTGHAAVRLQEHRRRWPDVRMRLLVAGSKAYIYALEEKAIEAFGTRMFGYNVASGGVVCRDPLPSTRAKMAAAKRGRQLPDKHKKKVIAILDKVRALGVERARTAPNPTRFKPGHSFGLATRFKPGTNKNPALS